MDVPEQPAWVKNRARVSQRSQYVHLEAVALYDLWHEQPQFAPQEIPVLHNRRQSLRNPQHQPGASRYAPVPQSLQCAGEFEHLSAATQIAYREKQWPALPYDHNQPPFRPQPP